nr:MAG TPA_asm: hypothetical protein [Caudoviricetes sp.]
MVSSSLFNFNNSITFISTKNSTFAYLTYIRRIKNHESVQGYLPPVALSWRIR